MRLSFLLLGIFSFFSCYSTKEKTVDAQTKQQLYPYLTKNHTYIYVDCDYTPVISTAFTTAGLFTSTGYAVVENDKGETAVINTAGKLVVPFMARYVSLQVLQDELTVVYTRETYAKNSRFWEWEWNIFSGLKTEVQRQKFEVYILETNQVLFAEQLSDKASLPTYVDTIDSEHFIFNQTLYKRKGQRLAKQKNNIIHWFDTNKLLQRNGAQFSILTLENKQQTLSNLEATQQVTFEVNGEELLLTEVNKSRYYSEIPEILYHPKTKEYRIEPLFEKVLPRQIKIRNEADYAYLQKVSYINSVPDYPYFILGVFDFDRWAFQWKYLTEDGTLLDTIDAPDFFVVDAMSRVQRPHPTELISTDQIPAPWRLDAVTKYSGFTHLFKITLKQEGQDNRYGLWNTQTKQWELQPIYRDFYWLDVEQGLLALAQEDNQYVVYNYLAKKNTTSAIFNYIDTSGWVTQVDTAGTKTSFYLDFATAKAYMENPK
ncbi:hypothetical protein [Myroides odoratus]|uniref:Uncharacterized protein n=1 Tax=Myroides odoratus TaxID=256 RepID=A0A378U7A7_MYROD|nr:hypothetical protein [Myroides odoratus]QQU02566.1 hypothetical protein I6I89_12090 [Myroides odoratus]STZ70222.1 Uncharacterised protein [Myroides odoratus]